MEYNNAEQIMKVLEEIPDSDNSYDWVVSIESRQPVRVPGEDPKPRAYAVTFVTDWSLSSEVLDKALTAARAVVPDVTYSVEVIKEAPVLVFF
jgi:hypothetical protein